MERTLLAVEPDVAGWRVSLTGKLIQHHEHKISAIGAATNQARTRHASTGEPTGVKVHVGTHSHDLVLVGLHG